MANEAYRAVFLRVHPTGKMVLSLTTEPDGNEANYAQLVADELGVPALDVKVVTADTDRFGNGHGFNTAPSPGASSAVTSTADKILAKARLLAGMALSAPPDEPRLARWRVRNHHRATRDDDDRRRGDVRARQRRAAPGSRGRPRRADGLPGLIS